MSLRTRLLVLFLALAVAPLLILGIIARTRSLQALEAMIAAQNTRVADRVAATIEQRAALIESDLLLLSENAETQRWLASVDRDSAARQSHDRFMRDAWDRMALTYASIVFAAPDGSRLYQSGEIDLLAPAGTGEPITLAIRAGGSSRLLGTVTVRPLLRAVIPMEVLSAGFGETGFGMVLDRASARVIYAPDPVLQGTVLDQLPPGVFGDSTGIIRYRARDTLRIASYHVIPSLPWAVVVSGAVSEFSDPFTRLGRNTLLLFLVVAALATVVFSQILRRTTRSLEDLTAATAVVADGNFEPDLPAAGPDEVGRLTVAFGGMVDKVHDTLAEIRTSRQMAVLGEFAAHLSHEVRNPLTSIKLNLQKLEREQRDGRLPQSASVPLGIALREAARLDDVVRGVLDLARTEPARREVTSLHRVVGEALEVVLGQAESRDVRIEQQLEAPRDRTLMDPSAVKGAILNLLLNGIEAMPSGGTLRIATASTGAELQLTITDTGPGVPEELRARIFQPFFSRREGGTGLGLPLARRAIEQSGGTLTLTPGNGPGAGFVIVFPEEGAA